MNGAPSTRRRGSRDTKRVQTKSPLNEITQKRTFDDVTEKAISPPLSAIATNSPANWFIVFVGDAIERKQNVWCCLMENQTGGRVAPSNRSIICEPDEISCSKSRNPSLSQYTFQYPYILKKRHSINTSSLSYYSYNPKYSMYIYSV